MKRIIVTWMAPGESPFKALITVASWAAIQPRQHEMHVFLGRDWSGATERAAEIEHALQRLGAKLHPGAEDAEDMRTSLGFLGLGGLGARPFLHVAPGTVIYADGFAQEHGLVATREPIPVWPLDTLYGPSRRAIWESLFETYGLSPGKLCDFSEHPESWRRWPLADGRIVLGDDAGAFSATYASYLKGIAHEPPAILDTQEARNHLVRIALPLTLAALGGRLLPAGDERGLPSGLARLIRVSYVYAAAPDAAITHLEDAVASNAIKNILKAYEPAKRLIYQGKGRELRKRFFDPRGQDPKHIIRRLRRHTKWWV